MCPAVCRVFADQVGTRHADPDAIDQQADDFAAVLYRLGEFLRGVAVFLAAARAPRTVLERTVVHAALVDVAARAHRHEQQQAEEHDATSKHGNPWHGALADRDKLPGPIILHYLPPLFAAVRMAGYAVVVRGDTSA